VLNASEVIALLGLTRHPEGGWFRQTWRAPADAGQRGVGTAIYFLLAEGDRSHWHRVDATEIWHYYAGDPLELAVSTDGERVEVRALGPDVASGQRPQRVVPPHAWQSARSLGHWTLAGCTVSPAFEFAGFELAPPGWSPTSTSA
jgi:predicted cupin superfamily sugar epimerase